MDPSLSVSSDHDPHHSQQQFYPFPPFAVHTPFGAPYSVTNSTVFGATSAAAATNNHHVAEAPTNTHHLSFNLPPYVDMICMAIAGLNEPEGSSKEAISSFIERVYSGLPPAHDALVSYHLTCLKNSGVLVMVQDSYKFPTGPPSSSAVQPFRTDVLSTITDQDRNLSDSIAPLPQKRGRGRPPKPKSEAQILGAQPKASERTVVQSNIDAGSDPGLDQPNSEPAVESETQVAKKPPGSPKTNETQLASPIAPVSGILKRRGRPPGVRGPGRPRKPKSVTAPAMVFPYATNGARRRGRPRRTESLANVPAVAAGGVVVSSGKRRGRPPKTNGVVDKPMKPLSRTGRPVGRPRKNATQNSAAYEELKRKFNFFQDTVKQALSVLKTEMDSENQVAVSAILELEGLVATDIDGEAAVAVEVQMQ